MDKAVVEITDPGRHLCVERGFMLVKEHGELLGKVPLDDISAVITNSYGVTFSNNIIMALADRNIPMICCGKNHVPSAVVWSLYGNYRQAACTDAQAEAPKALNKRLWQMIIKNKILMQARVLTFAGKNSDHLRQLSSYVKSGDTENHEARAAKYYWNSLFGDDFRRDRDQEGINSMLNYGYTVLRSLMARAVMGAGLNPALGIHHRNKLNPMRLVDDLMEPFRPMVDMLIYHILMEETAEVNKSVKKALSTIHFLPIRQKSGGTTIGFSVRDTAVSIAKTYLKETDKPILPESIPEHKYISEHYKKCLE
ncbi:MAG: type II CRISPR-associated endonuclease Cas1 [Spirochaetia bacterium]|jgi:CRISPR-associated protein Cas1|nr:type II CRISPR-associated endonuclease Cas1 [Spirochaetia bacterium]